MKEGPDFQIQAEKEKRWEWKITPNTSWFGSSFSELISYRDLLFGLVRKDLLASFQQTLLGPLWILIQPLISVWIFVLVFDKIIGVSTDGTPAFLFYLVGITLWNLFSDIFSTSSTVITQNAAIFSKVYFPRIISPLSLVMLGLFRFSINFIFLVIVLGFYFFAGVIPMVSISFLLFIPSILIVAGIALGGGMIMSIVTTRYRDLAGLVQLILRLMMFICPIFYSIKLVPASMKWLVFLNPLSCAFEMFRIAFLGKGQISTWGILYSSFFMIFLVVMGVMFFNKKVDKLMDVA